MEKKRHGEGKENEWMNEMSSKSKASDLAPHPVHTVRCQGSEGCPAHRHAMESEISCCLNMGGMEARRYF